MSQDAVSIEILSVTIAIVFVFLQYLAVRFEWKIVVFAIPAVLLILIIVSYVSPFPESIPFIGRGSRSTMALAFFWSFFLLLKYFNSLITKRNNPLPGDSRRE